MTESIRRENIHSIPKKSYLSTTLETLITNSNLKNPANPRIQEKPSKETQIFSPNIQKDSLLLGSTLLSPQSSFLLRQSSTLSSKSKQESSIYINSSDELTSSLKVPGNFPDPVLEDIPSSIHDMSELDPSTNYQFNDGLYSRINEYLEEHNLYAVEDPAVFSQSSIFNKKISFLKFQASLQSPKSSLNCLAIQSPRSKPIATKYPTQVSNLEELTLGSIKGSSLLQRRCSTQKANCYSKTLINSCQPNTRLNQPPPDITSSKLITIDEIGSNSFPSLKIKNGYLAEENYEKVMTPEFSSSKWRNDIC